MSELQLKLFFICNHICCQCSAPYLCSSIQLHFSEKVSFPSSRMGGKVAQRHQTEKSTCIVLHKKIPILLSVKILSFIKVNLMWEPKPICDIYLVCLEIMEVSQSCSVFCPCSLIHLGISQSSCHIIGQMIIFFLFKLVIWILDTGNLFTWLGPKLSLT